MLQKLIFSFLKMAELMICALCCVLIRKKSYPYHIKSQKHLSCLGQEQPVLSKKRKAASKKEKTEKTEKTEKAEKKQKTPEQAELEEIWKPYFFAQD